MANLGNAWHIPAEPEPRGRSGMRDPAGALVPGMDVTIITGNQFRGEGNTGDQLGVGSSLFLKRAAQAAWSELPLQFSRQVDNNKYFAATIPADTTREFDVGETIAYYLRIPYSDHDTTFLLARGDGSATTADESAARDAPFIFTLADPAVWGRWEPVFAFPNAAIHTHVLPSGRVLMWGRRDPSAEEPDDLDVHSCTPFVWDPEDDRRIPPAPQNPTARPSAVTINTARPLDLAGNPVNLFCSGHTFLPDGRLLVVGGHFQDSDGLNQATTYTPAPAGSDDPGTWTPIASMGPGDTLRRWYPTATALPSGGVLVMSGSYIEGHDPDEGPTINEPLLQVWENDAWRTIPKPDGTALTFNGPPLYPRMHVKSDGQVFFSGLDQLTQLLKTTAPGGWTPVAPRNAGMRDYAPALMYEQDMILYIGGGNDRVPGNASMDDARPPTNRAEIIDLGTNPARWSDTNPMHFPRRQHNGVLLPDGTVLVVGGTRGGGGARGGDGMVGFNDLTKGQPVHTAELWDPHADNEFGAWQKLAAEEIDRCYHSTAVLLPDARVLSAGGGEYRPDNVNPNDPEDSQHTAQVFSPPYLFKGARPVITSAPASVRHGQTFEVGTPDAPDVVTVSWIRLPSVTHAFDQSQRINVLSVAGRQPDALSVTAPDTPQLCPPGHYMLFVLTAAGVPSKAAIIQVEPLIEEAAPGAAVEGLAAVPVPAEDHGYEPPADARGTRVLIGLTGTCPYGIGACWGGAYDALGRLDGVGFVNPVPDTTDLTGQVFLTDDALPDLNTWTEQFYRIVNGSYHLRGFEVTVRGALRERDGGLLLRDSDTRPEVQLGPLSVDKVQWDRSTAAPQSPDQRELRAYDDLVAAGLADGTEVTVTGPLTQAGSRHRLQVRVFEV